jgi:hypothetical protein
MASMHRPSAIRQQFALAGLLLGLWCLLVLAMAGQMVSTGGPSPNEALMASIRDWLPWALLAPLVAWLALRFPLERRKLAWSIPVHIAGCLLALVIYEALAPHGPTRFGPQPGGPGTPFRSDPLREGPPPEGFLFPPEQRPLGPGFPPGAGPANRGFPHRPLFPTARFNIPIYWVIVSMVQALTFYRRSEESERQALELGARLADAKLHALQMQLHPHFLFNTLNAI